MTIESYLFEIKARDNLIVNMRLNMRQTFAPIRDALILPE
jgi:hypothetical protein